MRSPERPSEPGLFSEMIGSLFDMVKSIGSAALKGIIQIGKK